MESSFQQAQMESASSSSDGDEQLQQQQWLRSVPVTALPLHRIDNDELQQSPVSGEATTSSSEVHDSLVASSPLHQQQLRKQSPLLSLQEGLGPSRGRRLTQEPDELPDSRARSRLSIANSRTVPTAPTTIGDVILNRQSFPKKRTLVVYSGPTSLNRSIGKNDVYLANFDYFIQHGIECNGLGGTDEPRSSSNLQPSNSHIEYAIVLTQPVAERYTASDGLLTQKQYECGPHAKITVLVREDRCYDMESVLLVSRTFDIPHQYDHMVYVNCGIAGPKFGPGSPKHWENLSSWTELYTSLLSDKIQMVGHTINTHFNTVYSPHVQSFLFAINTPVLDIWIKTGALYECGISNADFKDDLVRMALVWRYEVGISRVLLERGHSIAAAFMHQQGRIGEPLIIDWKSTFGRHFSQDEIIHSDVMMEDGVRRLTESSFPEYGDHRKYAILPWDCYVFFKVSRLIPFDIQQVMQYGNLGSIKLVQNDARQSSVWEWRRKAGVSIIDGLARLVLGDAYHAVYTGNLRCHGQNCDFDKVTTSSGGIFAILLLSALFIRFFASSKHMRRILVQFRPKRTKNKR